MGATGPRAGAAAGAVAVLLFVASALVQGGGRPPFDAPAAEVATWLDADRTRIQVSCLLFAAATPFLVWFLTEVRARSGEPRAAGVALGCGLVFVTLFLADITALAVAALRPENMAAEPELATALLDVELLLMGSAAFPAAGMLAAFALVEALPRWLRTAAVVAAALYLLRAATLLTVEGPFAADGVLGLYVPVAALAGWIIVAALALAARTSTAST